VSAVWCFLHEFCYANFSLSWFVVCKLTVIADHVFMLYILRFVKLNTVDSY
jgi:hypothetical protein